MNKIVDLTSSRHVISSLRINVISITKVLCHVVDGVVSTVH